MNTIKSKAAPTVGRMVLFRFGLFDQWSVFFPVHHYALYKRYVLDDPLRRRISPMISDNLEESLFRT